MQGTSAHNIRHIGSLRVGTGKRENLGVGLRRLVLANRRTMQMYVSLVVTSVRLSTFSFFGSTHMRTVQRYVRK